MDMEIKAEKVTVHRKWVVKLQNNLDGRKMSGKDMRKM